MNEPVRGALTGRSPYTECVRGHGVIDSAGGFGHHDHACWPFDEPSEFVAAAVEFLADGLDGGQRLIYVNEGTPEQLRHDLADLGGVSELERTGALALCPVEAFCDPSAGVVSAQQLAFWDALVARAHAEGFTGVRFAAQVTCLAAPPLSWLTHVRWEQLADSYIDMRPLSALCGSQRDAVGEAALQALSAVHPLRAGDASPFGVFVLHGDLWIEGELDALQMDLAADLLASVPVDGDDVVVNVSRLEFADGAATAELARFARRLGQEGRRVVLRDASPMLRRVWDLLGFSAIAPVDFAA